MTLGKAPVQRLWLWLRNRPRLPRLPLRLRLALWSSLLVLVLSFVLLLFINLAALDSFPRIVRGNYPQERITAVTRTLTQTTSRLPPTFVTRMRDLRELNPLEGALLLELRSLSLVGLILVTVIGGVSAYFVAGLTLRPVRKVSKAAQRISANTLNTRLALAGPRDEVKELADTFDAMLGRLEHTFEQQSRFVGDVAHELRTPLASLRANLEVVASDEDATSGDYREMVAAQERALTRLERIVADLLILSKSEQPVPLSDVSLGVTLEEVFSDLCHKADERQVQLSIINHADIVVQGNEALLARVFSNLIENAINYNQPGGEVIVTIDRKESWAIVAVADTGIGMTPETREHIFDRFYRADGSRSRHTGGAGLGLSIVSAITQQHSGQVSVTSAPGAGSTFTVLLPIQLNSNFIPPLVHSR